MSLNSPTTLSTTLRERSLHTISLASVEWAHRVALIVERQLRATDDPAERARLKQARDWHYATLADELIARPRKASVMSATPSAGERLKNPDALLSRTDLRELGLERRAVDSVFRSLDVVCLPGYSRPLVRVSEYLELLEQCTYRGDRVR